MSEDYSDLAKKALDYHQFPTPGKIKVVSTKNLSSNAELTLAYSPGVAVPCLKIKKNPQDAYKYTSKGNLVAVISNGTAVLGLGNIGPLASKPVMEGKGVLFKLFSNIDVFDIEINESDPQKLVDIIASLEPTFGGINLEDIKAPDCFYVEQELKKRMNIPVFHDDQHGTAIIASAALVNALNVVNKKIEDVKIVVSGAGAAAIACLNLMVSLGLKKENIVVCDSKGVIYKGRGPLDHTKELYAIEDNGQRSIKEAIVGTDVFLGLSVRGLIDSKDIAKMNDSPIILSLANPDPEITPAEAMEGNPRAIVCTGRSDYPNQVNNVLCFPFIFRGALDVGAQQITEEMKVACVHAIAELARRGSEPDENGYVTPFGAHHVIPSPFDTRLLGIVAPAVAKTAMEQGIATKEICLEEYKVYLQELMNNH